MLGKNKRKGFTLAELLIVVAIIAVLVAIAVPLFISGLKKAQTARDDANKRSVKAAAIVYILNAKSDDGNIYNDGAFYDNYEIVANVTEGGKITLNTVKQITTAGEEKVSAAKGGGWDITVYVSASDLNMEKVNSAAGAGG